MAKDNKKNTSNKKEPTALERARRANAQASTKKQSGSRTSYWKGVKHELSKVVWPTRKQLATYTGVVIVTCAVFALGFWLIDTGVLAVLKHVLGITLS